MTNISTEIEKALLLLTPDLENLKAKLDKVGIPTKDFHKQVYDVSLRLNESLHSRITRLELILTNACNLACGYCFENEMSGVRSMPLSIARSAVDLLIDHSGGEKHLHLTHFGGEPTLRFAAIGRITEYAERQAKKAGKSIAFGVTSNGVLLTEEMVDYFADHHITVLLSIDGLEASHDAYRVDAAGVGSFARSMKGLDLLKKRQPWIQVKMTVMPGNAWRLFDDVVGLHARGVNQFIIGHATGVRWSADEMKILTVQIGKLHSWYRSRQRKDIKIDMFDEKQRVLPCFGCAAGVSTIAVSVEGEVFPCSKLAGIGGRRLACKLGDVHYGLTHLMNRSELIGCSRLRSACKEREIHEIYEGGCFADNFRENGDMFLPSRIEHEFSTLIEICFDPYLI